MTNKRRKAWIGAAIAAGTSLVSGLISNNAQKRQARRERAASIEQAAYEKANALQNSMNDNITDDYLYNKIILKQGGKINMDRIKYSKQFKCGGRSKKENGGFAKFMNGAGGAAAIEGIANIATTLMTPHNSNVPIKVAKYNFGDAKNTITPNSYDNVANTTATIANNQFEDRLTQERFGYKCGGKSKRK